MVVLPALQGTLFHHVVVVVVFFFLFVSVVVLLLLVVDFVPFGVFFSFCSFCTSLRLFMMKSFGVCIFFLSSL